MRTSHLPCDVRCRRETHAPARTCEGGNWLQNRRTHGQEIVHLSLTMNHRPQNKGSLHNRPDEQIPTAAVDMQYPMGSQCHRYYYKKKRFSIYHASAPLQLKPLNAASHMLVS